jgi:hypothetical protein
MRSGFVAVALIAFASAPVLGQAIEGVWKPAVVVIDSGANRGRHTTDVQPGLMIFTQRHYSMLFVNGFAPRPQLSDSATDAELGRVFGPFTANSGTYQRTDSTITFTPSVAKVPAVMAGTPFTLRARAKGDTLWLVGGPGGFSRQQTTWVRVERR